MNRRDFIASATTAAVSLGVARAESRPNSAWSALADMPFPAQEIYPCSFRCGDEPVIVNAGGIIPGKDQPLGVTAATVFYVPRADIWNEGATLPAPRHHIALAESGGVLFAIGGFFADGGGQWRMQADVWRIEDLNRGKWERTAPLPAPQAEAVTLSHDGLIHVIGGRTPTTDRNLDWTDQGDTGRHLVYDPKSDKWSEAAPLSEPRNSAAGAIVGDNLYVISGRTVVNGNNPACHAYDPRADAWRLIEPLPESSFRGAPKGRGGLAAAALGGKIYAFGGEWFGESAGVYPDALVYDPAKDKWKSAGAMPRPRHGLGAVTLGEAIYVIGGATGPSAAGTSAFLDRFIP